MTTICESAAEAVADVEDGSTGLVSGFGIAGMPVQLVDALWTPSRWTPIGPPRTASTRRR
jgi:acyl CoA:acetate/3-ketoacid CoA transferase alpha subunit